MNACKAIDPCKNTVKVKQLLLATRQWPIYYTDAVEALVLSAMADRICALAGKVLH